MHDSVRHHLVADVPVAVFLSAGLDSGALLGTMAELGARDTLAVTLAFEEFRARRTTRRRSPPRSPRATAPATSCAPSIAREFERDLPAILDAMDLPTIDGINTWFVAKAAHEAGIKVALSGLGADECFGGYPSFIDVPRSVHLLRPFGFVPGLGALVRRADVGRHRFGRRRSIPRRRACCNMAATGRAPICCAAASTCRGSSTTCSIPRWCEEGLRRLAPLSRIAAELQAGRPLGDFDRVAALETSLYMRNQLLRDADWAGMAHSIEIRVPYVDPFFLAALPPGDVLAAINAKEAVADCRSRRCRTASRNRAKTGFVDAGRPLDARSDAATARGRRPSPARRAPGHCASGRPAGPASAAA